MTPKLDNFDVEVVAMKQAFWHGVFIGWWFGALTIIGYLSVVGG